MPRKEKVLVTFVRGRQHQALWRHFLPTWKAYAEQYNYDIITLDQPIDPNFDSKGKSLHWQKCLVLEHPDVAAYEDVVWIDCDILVNHRTAPCIVTETAGRGIGAVLYSSQNQPNPRTRAAREDRLYRVSVLQKKETYGLGRYPEAREMYARAGLGDDVNDWINTGVMVLKPARDAEILRHVYETCEETPFSLYDNFPLSYHLLKRNLVHGLDPRFNADYLYEVLESYPFLTLSRFGTPTTTNLTIRSICAFTIINNNWFIHAVAGAPEARNDLLRIPLEVLMAPEFEKYLRLVVPE